jgi:hypothetical protein
MPDLPIRRIRQGLHFAVANRAREGITHIAVDPVEHLDAVFDRMPKHRILLAGIAPYI